MVGQWDVETRSLFTCVLAGAGYVREVVSKPGCNPARRLVTMAFVGDNHGY